MTVIDPHHWNKLKEWMVCPECSGELVDWWRPLENMKNEVAIRCIDCDYKVFLDG